MAAVAEARARMALDGPDVRSSMKRDAHEALDADGRTP